MRRTSIFPLVTVLLLVAVAGALTVVAQSNGIPAKRPIFGGSCQTCPWGVLGDAVKEAMAPGGYDVQICYSCGGPARSVRLVADAQDTTPPQNATAATPPTPAGRVDFGGTGAELLQYAYLGIHDFAQDKEGPRKHLRLIANLQTPTYYLIAVNAKSGITDLRQIADKKMPVKLVARGSVTDGVNAAVLKYYGLSEEIIKSFGGAASSSYGRGTDVDVIIGWTALLNAPEYAVWYDAPQQHDLKFLDVPADLRTQLAKTFLVREHVAPIGVVRGMDRRIPTVVRSGNAIYGRADLPDAFAYAVAQALDQHQDALQWTIMPFTYNPTTVWKLGEVPLHAGAARYYKERGYMR